MEERWASSMLPVVLLYSGALPLTPDVPLPFVSALLALVLVATAPLASRVARTLSHQIFVPLQPSIIRQTTPGAWQLFRPVAPGTRGTVRSRAPSLLLAAHA